MFIQENRKELFKELYELAYTCGMPLKNHLDISIKKGLMLADIHKANKEIVDGEKVYKPANEIQLSDKKYLGRDKKEKRVRKPEMEVINIIREIVPKNKNITPKEIADIYDIPENQVKEVMAKICDRIDDGTRKGCYVLKLEL